MATTTKFPLWAKILVGVIILAAIIVPIVLLVKPKSGSGSSGPGPSPSSAHQGACCTTLGCNDNTSGPPDCNYLGGAFYPGKYCADFTCPSPGPGPPTPGPSPGPPTPGPSPGPPTPGPSPGQQGACCTIKACYDTTSGPQDCKQTSGTFYPGKYCRNNPCPRPSPGPSPSPSPGPSPVPGPSGGLTIYGLTNEKPNGLYKTTHSPDGTWSNWQLVSQQVGAAFNNIQVADGLVYGVGQYRTSAGGGIYRLDLANPSQGWKMIQDPAKGGQCHVIWVDQNTTYGIGNSATNTCVYKRPTFTYDPAVPWTRVDTLAGGCGSVNGWFNVQVVNNTIYVLNSSGIVYSMPTDGSGNWTRRTIGNHRCIHYMQIVGNTIYGVKTQLPGSASCSSLQSKDKGIIFYHSLSLADRDSDWTPLSPKSGHPRPTIFQFQVANNGKTIYGLEEGTGALYRLDVISTTDPSQNTWHLVVNSDTENKQKTMKFSWLVQE